MAVIKERYPEHFAWLQPPYEYEYEKMPVEILAGSTKIPRFIEAGTGPDEIRTSWRDDLAFFRKQREPYLLYG
jgi:uncharacterized protein YbbC (DUF1343 family)